MFARAGYGNPRLIGPLTSPLAYFVTARGLEAEPTFRNKTLSGTVDPRQGWHSVITITLVTALSTIGSSGSSPTAGRRPPFPVGYAIQAEPQHPASLLLCKTTLSMPWGCVRHPYPMMLTAGCLRTARIG
jgi:hypothetical protein